MLSNQDLRQISDLMDKKFIGITGPMLQDSERISIWRKVERKIQGYLSKKEFDTWFGELKLGAIERGRVTIFCEDFETRYFLSNYYKPIIKRAFEHILKQEVEISLEYDPVNSIIMNEKSEKRKYEKVAR